MVDKHAHIGAYGGDKTAAQWFNWLWSQLRPQTIFAVSEEIVTEFVRPLCEYALGKEFENWAESADCDMEPGLLARIEQAKANGVAESSFPTDLPDLSVRFNIFDDDTMLDDWICERIRWASYFYDRDHSGVGNPIIWMYGEKGPGSRPEFKEGAFDIYLEESFAALDYIYDALCEGTDFHLYEMKASGFPGEFDIASSSTVTLDELSDFGGEGDFLLVCKSRFDYYNGHTMLAMMSCLGLLPEETRNIVLVQHSAYYDLSDELSNALAGIPIRLLYDDTGKLGEALLATDLFEEGDGLAYDDEKFIPMYTGALSPHMVEIAARIEKTEALVNLVDIGVSRVVGYGLGYDLTQAVRTMLPMMTAGRYGEEDVALPPFGKRGLEISRKLAEQKGLCEPISEYKPRTPTGEVAFVGDICELWSASVRYPSDFPERAPGIPEVCDKLARIGRDAGMESQLDALFNGVPLADIIGYAR